MLYVMLLSWKPGLSREQQDAGLVRRSQWKYPAGAKVVGEYWPSTPSPAVIAIFEASDYEPIMEIGMTWSDVFDVTTVPATTPEEGLRLGPQIMQRRPA
ncbi:MAG: DUF3303 domain-containing protein [Dehalococcoidia bacterium]